MMKKMHFTFFVAAILYGSIATGQGQLIGFSKSGSDQQRQWEARFDSLLSATNVDEWMRLLTSRPHHLGSPKGKENAEFIADRFRSWGYDVAIETYDVLFPTPKTRVLQLLGAKAYQAKLQEAVLKEDRTSGQKSAQLPTYNAYSADGDVTAPLVFVNRGVPADYEVLKKMGVDVKGKIVIAKYGGSWRGIKPKVAAEHGAVGCIIYSDPADDGYAIGDVYPEGAYKPATGVQRGSVMDMPVYPGDPLTPGTGATANAKRLDRKDAQTLMKIPVLPISYEDALPFLRILKGQVVPPSWRGALPLTYHVGPSVEKVRLKLEFDWKLHKLYNVIAKIKGAEFPDEWLIRGNHHDAWVNGATDPISGIVSEMEEARAIGELVKAGLKPKRTLVYCAWDGEEQGLIGSVEWAEHHKEELMRKAVVYVNTDATQRGFIDAGGSHTLEPFFNQVAQDVIDPQTSVDIRKRWYARRLTGMSPDVAKKNLGDNYMRLDALGSGSDWSAFLHHLGIASLNLSFNGEGGGGEYHSIYDSYDHFTRFKDPGFHYVLALAKTTGRVMMRMANASILPFDYRSFSETIGNYTNELKSLLESSRAATEIENRMVAENLYKLAYDPKDSLRLPVGNQPVPYLDFSALENKLVELKRLADLFKESSPAAINLPLDKQKELNGIFMSTERTLTSDKGLEGRQWYKHLVYAPGIYTGYGVKTLPGIREAIELRKWAQAEENIRMVTERLDEYNALVLKALEILKLK